MHTQTVRSASARPVVSGLFRSDGVISSEGMAMIGRARAATGLPVDQLTLAHVASFAPRGQVDVITEEREEAPVTQVFRRPIGGGIEARRQARAEQEAAEAARAATEAQARLTAAAVASTVGCNHAGCRTLLLLDTGYVTLPDRLRVVDEEWLRRQVHCQGHKSPGSIRVETAKRQVASAKARAEAEAKEVDARGEAHFRDFLKRRR